MQTPTDAGEASSTRTSTQGSTVDLEIVGSRIIPPPSFQKEKNKRQSVKDALQKTQVSQTANRSHASKKLTSRAAQEPPEKGKEATRSRGYSKGDQKRVSETLRKKDTSSQVKETSPKNLLPTRPVRGKSNSTVSDAKGSSSNLKLSSSEIKVQRKTGIKVERGSAKMVPDGGQSSLNLKPFRTDSPEAGYSKRNKDDTSLNSEQTDRRSFSGSRKSTLSHARTKEKPSNFSTDVQENRKDSTGSLQARSALNAVQTDRRSSSGSRKSTLSHARTKEKPSNSSTDVQENRKGSTGSLQARSALNAVQTDRRPSSGSRKSTPSHARAKEKPSNFSTDVQENRKGSTGSLQARSVLKDREVNRMHCSTGDIAVAAKEQSHSQQKLAQGGSSDSPLNRKSYKVKLSNERPLSNSSTPQKKASEKTRQSNVGSSSVREVRTLNETHPVKVGPSANSTGECVSVKESEECLSGRKAFSSTASIQKESGEPKMPGHEKMASSTSTTSSISCESFRCGQVSPAPSKAQADMNFTEKDPTSARPASAVRNLLNTGLDTEHNTERHVGTSRSKNVSTCQQSARRLGQRPESARPGTMRSTSSMARSDYKRCSSARSSRASPTQFEVLQSPKCLQFASPSYPEVRPRSSRSQTEPNIMEVLSRDCQLQPRVASSFQKRRKYSSPEKRSE